MPQYDPAQHPNIEKLRQILSTLGPMIQSVAQNKQKPGGSPVISPAQVPQVNYDPSAAAGRLPMPPGQRPAAPGFSPSGTEGEMMSKLDPKGAATFSAIQGVSKLLQDFESRKDQRENAEAANIAQNLMKAMDSNDVATVHEILNDKHSTKVLNKVYKGWLTKAKEAQQPGEPPDPTMAGFEKGISQYVQGKTQQQPQMPKTMGGYLLPQAGPAQRLQAAQVSAEEQAAQQDPNRLLSSQLTSQEQRLAELQKMGMTEAQAQATIAKYEAQIGKAKLDTDRAQAELQKVLAEVKLEETKAAAAGEEGKIRTQELQQRLLIAQTNAEIARTRLGIVQSTAGGKNKVPPLLVKTRWDALQSSFDLLDGLEKSGSLYSLAGIGQPTQELKNLQGKLRLAGLSALASSIPTTGFFTNKKDLIQSLRNQMTEFRDSTEQAIHDNYPSWDIPGGRIKPDTEGDSEEEPSEPTEGEPMEGDIIDGYRFKGGDPANRANYEKVPEKP